MALLDAKHPRAVPEMPRAILLSRAFQTLRVDPLAGQAPNSSADHADPFRSCYYVGLMTTLSATPLSTRSKYDGCRMTLAQYLALPDEKPALQYIHGRVVQKAVGKQRQGRSEAFFTVALYAYARDLGGDAVTEPHIWFDIPGDPGFLVPDVAYWAPHKPQGDDDRMLPPTIAVEIRSPDEAMASQRRKCRLMLAHGVDECWLINPERRSVETLSGRDGELKIVSNALESDLLPGFAFNLADLWAALDR